MQGWLCSRPITNNKKQTTVVLGGVMVTVLVIGPKVRGSVPGRELWIIKGDQNQEHDFHRRRSKAVGPMLYDFTAC
jgi:hypothetical protein